MHRVIGKRDVYALYNFPEGTKCFFKAKGSVQLWNPWNGETASLSKFAVQTNEGTEVTLPLSFKEIRIIVFDPDNKGSKNVVNEHAVIKQVDLGKKWEFELKPSLDNQWGDFQLPAKKEMLGAQVNCILVRIQITLVKNLHSIIHGEPLLAHLERNFLRSVQSPICLRTRKSSD